MLWPTCNSQIFQTLSLKCPQNPDIIRKLFFFLFFIKIWNEEILNYTHIYTYIKYWPFFLLSNSALSSKTSAYFYNNKSNNYNDNIILSSYNIRLIPACLWNKVVQKRAFVYVLACVPVVTLFKFMRIVNTIFVIMLTNTCIVKLYWSIPPKI